LIIFPRKASWGVRSSPSRKLILAAVDGMKGSIKKDSKRMKLRMLLRTRGVLNK
jgi:hypothetical protein